jgi:hypothetical protein
MPFRLLFRAVALIPVLAPPLLPPGNGAHLSVR